VPLNISGKQSIGDKASTKVATKVRRVAARQAAKAAAGASGAETRRLVAEAVAELSSWSPREFLTAFQRWHQGELSLTHLNVLTLLEAAGPQSMGRLADSLDVSEASMTGIIDRMEKRELVVRQRDAADRRVVLVVPAEGGAKVFGEIDQRRRKGLAKLLDQLSDEQLEGLLDGHRALRAARHALAQEMDRMSGDLRRAGPGEEGST
jgi:DNA-binding MarR family transcriptional regulator